MAQAYRALRPPDGSAQTLSRLLTSEAWRDRLREQLAERPCVPVFAEGARTIRFVRPGEALALPWLYEEAFGDSPERRPDLLFGGPVVAHAVCGEEALELFRWLGWLEPMGVREISEAWRGGLEAWWEALELDAEGRKEALLDVWRGVGAWWSKFQALPQRLQKVACVRTASGQWHDVTYMQYTDAAHPREEEPGYNGAWSLLVPKLPTPARSLPEGWRQELREANSLSPYNGAWRWFQENATRITLKQVVREAFEEKLDAQVLNWRSFVDLGQWLDSRDRLELMTHVVVHPYPRGKHRLCRVQEALVAEPYCVDAEGSLRRVMRGAEEVITGAYAAGGSAQAWRRKLEELKAQGPPRLQTHVLQLNDLDALRIVISDRRWRPRRRKTRGAYEITWKTLTPALPTPTAPEAQRRRLWEWLEPLVDELAQRDARRFEIDYFHRTDRHEHVPNRMWITPLEQLAWVPTQDSDALKRPAEVLLEYDEARPEAPVAKLPKVFTKLKGVLNFGAEVPAAPVVQRLVRLGPSASSAELVELLREVRALPDVMEAERDQLEAFFAGPHLPVPKREDRVSVDRLVRRALGGGRGLLRDWLVRLDRLDEGLAEERERPEWGLRVADMATGQQALACLRELWRRARVGEDPPTSEDRRVMPVAMGYVLEDITGRSAKGEPPDLRLAEALRGALGEVMVYTNLRDWRPRDEVMWLDRGSGVAALAHTLERPLANLDDLGRNSAEQDDAARRLGLKKLSDEVELCFDCDARLDSAKWQERYARLCALLCLRGKLSDTPLTRQLEQVERLEAPALTHVRGLRVWLAFHDDGTEREVQRDALLNEDTLYVSGEPIRFAGHAAEALCNRYEVPHTQTGQAMNLLLGLQDADLYRDREDEFIRASLNVVLSEDRRRLEAWLERLLTAPRSPEEAQADPTPPRPPTPSPRTPGTGATPPTDPDSPPPRRPPGAPPIEGGRGTTPPATPNPRPGRGAEDGPGGRRPGGAPGERPTTSGRPRRRPRTTTSGQAPNMFRVLVRPEGERDAQDPPRPPKDDRRAREIVKRYEERDGREVTVMASGQAGYDVESADRATGITRRIEIKGLAQSWEGEATVTMTNAQFRLARANDDPKVEYWLYVVSHRDSAVPRVQAIRNPAKRANRFYLQAMDWREVVSESADLTHRDDAHTEEDVWGDAEACLPERLELIHALRGAGCPMPAEYGKELKENGAVSGTKEALLMWERPDGRRVMVLDEAVDWDDGEALILRISEATRPDEIAQWVRGHIR